MKRRTLELALAKARTEHDAATNPHHRHMLAQAIRALEDSLQRLT